MSAFTIEKLPNELIVIITENAAYTPTEHFGQLKNAAIAEVVRFDRPGYIIDIANNNYDFDGILLAVEGLRVEGEALRRLPHYRGMLVVTADQEIKAIYAGMASQMFGGLIFRVFDTLDEALDYARANS